jgi:hypothetical protein
MAVEYSYGEADAFLRLPSGSPHSVMLEAMQDQSACIDYSLKQGFNRNLFKGTRLV